MVMRISSKSPTGKGKKLEAVLYQVVSSDVIYYMHIFEPNDFALKNDALEVMENNHLNGSVLIQNIWF